MLDQKGDQWLRAKLIAALMVSLAAVIMAWVILESTISFRKLSDVF